MDWATLPKELVITIFSFLKCADLTSVVCVNSTWRTLADYNDIWKNAILNDSFPHNYSASQKNVPWRQIAKKHFETKRNITKRRCVQHTLGTRCPGPNDSTSIVLASKSANTKYCILVWDMIEAQGYSYQSDTHLATELWDLEKRTIISNHTSSQLELFNDFLVKIACQTYTDDRQIVNQTFYSKFDDNEFSDLTLKSAISIPNPNHEFISVTFNEDPNSSLVAVSWISSTWANEEFVRAELNIWIYDLRTGEKLLEKKYDYTDNLIIMQFYGDKLLLRYHDSHGFLVLNVLRNTEVPIELLESQCATIAGNKVWAVTHEGTNLVEYDIQTKEKVEYKMRKKLGSVISIRIYDGLIWLFIYGTMIAVVDLLSDPKCRVLTHISLPGWDRPTITPLANGTFAFLATSYTHILSFRDEDIELPIEVLQFEPNGKSEKIIYVAQGDLNETISEYCPTSVTSQIVFEDETQRYCVIFCCNDHKDKGVNQFVEIARKWIEKPEYHKTAIFQLVNFDVLYKPTEAMNSTAFGRAWVIYETKVNGAWQRAAPLDHWKFFKETLGLK